MAMTPEDERKMRAAIFSQLQKPQQPGMVNQSAVTPEMIAAAGQDYSGQEKRLGRQQKFAQDMMGGAGPKGRMMGDIYAAPTWTEQAADVLRKGTGAYAAYKTGQAQSELDPKIAAASQAQTELAQAQLQDANRFKTAERVAGQDFKGGQQANVLAQDMSQFTAEQALGLKKWRDTSPAVIAAEGREDVRTIAKEGRDEVRDQAAETRDEERGWQVDPYMLDGKLTTIAWNDDLGEGRKGTAAGASIPPEVMQNAVIYRPGVEKGTTADAAYMNNRDPATAGQAPPKFMGNILTGDFFETGILNPKRWLGSAGLGPDGQFIEAAHKQMATANLDSMAGRMEQINLRPWTPEEIRTISKDFPSPNDKYPSWANFTYNIIRPKVVNGFAEAKRDGVTPTMSEEEVLKELDYDIIEGARMQGVPLPQLAKLLGMPEERVREYLKTLSR